MSSSFTLNLPFSTEFPMELPIVFLYARCERVLQAALHNHPLAIIVNPDGFHYAVPYDSSEGVMVFASEDGEMIVPRPIIGVTCLDFSVLEACHRMFVQALSADFEPLAAFWKKIRHYGTRDLSAFCKRGVLAPLDRLALAVNVWCRHELRRHEIHERARVRSVDVSGIIVHLLNGVEEALSGKDGHLHEIFEQIDGRAYKPSKM